MFETGATLKDYYRITKTMNISKTYSPFGLDYMYIFFSKVTSNCQILEVHTHSVHVCNVKTKRTILLLSYTYMVSVAPNAEFYFILQFTFSCP